LTFNPGLTKNNSHLLHSDHHCDRIDRIAWEVGKVYGFLLGLHTVNFVLSSRAAAKRK